MGTLDSTTLLRFCHDHTDASKGNLSLHRSLLHKHFLYTCFVFDTSVDTP